MVASRRGRIPLLLLAATLDSVPSPAGAFTCETAGGRPWREVTSEHFVVATDLASDDSAGLARELERMRAAVMAALFQGRSEVAGRMAVVAFRSTEDFEDYAASHVGAFYAAFDSVERAIVLPGIPAFPGGRGMGAGETLAHELTHHLLSYALARRPAWLNEGLACFLEPLGASRPGDALEVGRVPASRRVRKRKDRVPLAELLGWDGSWSEIRMARHYDTSWLLVHFLVTRRAEGFSDLMRRLGRGEEPRAAWTGAFPQWDPGRKGALDELEEELDVHGRGGAFGFLRLPDGAGEARPGTDVASATTERPLTSAAVHALRIRLWPYRQSERGEAALRAEVAEALAEDPGEPLALATRARLDRADPVAAARRGTAAHPEDPRAWQLLAVALERGDVEERLAARQRAAALGPDDPAILAGLTRDLVAAGHSGMAVPVVRRMLSAAPYSWGVFSAAAAAAGDLGACGDALSLQRRALEILPERSAPALRAELAATLAGYERQCEPAH